MFFIAPNKHNKLAKPLTRALMCPKPLKKRSYLISTPFILAPKKIKLRVAPQPTRISPPLCPKVSLFTLLPLVSAQPLVDIDIKDNDKEEVEVEDDDIEEPPELLAVVRFISIWKAFNKKKVLPRSRLAILD